MESSNTDGAAWRADLSGEAARVVHFFENLDAVTVEHVERIYADDAYFKDPFNEVRGVGHVRRIFLHMFEQVDDPRFAVLAAVQQGPQVFLTWDFRFRMKRFDTRTRQTIRGASHLRFAADGRIAFHRDYWDAAEELYEKLPLLGALMRWLKRQAA